ncbi:serine/threonine-protein phosphatase 2A 56 kDa regulatory subunit delta isoform, partial [Tieghemiomyces parasiticus]
VADTDRPALFIKKLELCSIVFDFSDSASNTRYKEAKQRHLVDLVEHISTNRGVVTEQVYPVVFSMKFAANLFRTIPPQVNPAGEQFDPDDDDPVLEVAWPHLQIVYEFFLRFIESPDFDSGIARNYIDQKFIQELLQLFDSEDPREREYLKTTLHRMYGKFLHLRAFIRRSINHIFLYFIYENERHHGIAELLEILGSIINGFALPLKEEHQTFLAKVLLPLHKTKSLILYYQQLSYCTIQFLEKDPRLTGTVVRGLLKFWPKVNSPKEVMFLNELEEILAATDDEHFGAVCVPVFKQIARCMASPHFQVADRALGFWRNECLVELISRHRATILPIVFPVLMQHSRSHWHRNVHQQMYSTLQFFIDEDPELYDRCAQQAKEQRQAERVRARAHEMMWQEVQDVAEGSRIQRPTGGLLAQHHRSNPASLLTLRGLGSPGASLSSPTHSFSESLDSGEDDSDLLHGLTEGDGGTEDDPTAGPAHPFRRRKSVLPIDEQVLRELSKYRGPETVVSMDLDVVDLRSPATPYFDLTTTTTGAVPGSNASYDSDGGMGLPELASDLNAASSSTSSMSGP